MDEIVFWLQYWVPAAVTLGYNVKAFGDYAPLAVVTAAGWPVYWLAYLGYWLSP